MSKHWTVENIPDLKGKVIIVTGANSGIGYESALEFARKGAQVVMACRNMEKAGVALAAIQEEVPGAAAEIMRLDIADLSSVREFVTAFTDKYERLDVLLNNAGIMMVPYGTTVDGFERQTGTNHMGHFALTGLLLNYIRKTPGARVVNVSSNAHKFGKINFDNLMFDGGKGYKPMKAYGYSKLANMLFTYELQRLFDAHDIDAIAVAAHPGGSDTNLASHFEEKWLFRALKPMIQMMVQSAAMGAMPSIRACTDPEVKGGEYYGPRGFQQLKGHPVKVESNKASHDEAAAKTLWEMSEELTKVTYAW